LERFVADFAPQRQRRRPHGSNFGQLVGRGLARPLQRKRTKTQGIRLADGVTLCLRLLEQLVGFRQSVLKLAIADEFGEFI
jgi:hypothetical protein